MPYGKRIRSSLYSRHTRFPEKKSKEAALAPQNQKTFLFVEGRRAINDIEKI